MKVLLGVTGVLAVTVAAVWWYALHLPGQAHHGPLPAATDGERALAGRLRRHVEGVASRPHNVAHYEALSDAAAYIERALMQLGLPVERQTFQTDGREVANIVATVEPRTGVAAQSIVIGAHYDSAGDAPGANDNGSGVAALIEIAAALKASPPPGRRVRLVFFVNEEPPYFGTDQMGSARYARMIVARGEQVAGMISLETIGFYSDAAGSQRYPAPLSVAFPATADFVAFVAMPGARTWLHEVIGAFRRYAAFPTIGGVAPSQIDGIAWSDHASFAAHGIPAVMITDTALFRYRHYHTPQDTSDKLDYDRLARVTRGIAQAVVERTR